MNEGGAVIRSDDTLYARGESVEDARCDEMQICTIVMRDEYDRDAK